MLTLLVRQKPAPTVVPAKAGIQKILAYADLTGKVKARPPPSFRRKPESRKSWRMLTLPVK